MPRSPKIDDKIFWAWINPPKPAYHLSINKYLEIISKNQIDKGYIVGQIANSNVDSSKIMDQLSLTVPRKYFLELQFCAKTYTSILGKIFPPLAPYIGELVYIEWLLYVEPGVPRYRDHLVHMFKVALMMDVLLGDNGLFEKTLSLQFKSPHFKEWCDQNSIKISSWDENAKKDIIRMACFIAALFHDFGYGYYFLRKYKDRLFKLYSWLPPGTNPIDAKASSCSPFMKSLPAQFIIKHHEWLGKPNRSDNIDHLVAGFFRDCLPLNHSIASTLFVLGIAEKFSVARALNQELYVAFQLAAEAIMTHDMTCEKRWAHLKSETGKCFLNTCSYKEVPLSILLILADELSTWNRSRIIPNLKKNSVNYELDKSYLKSLNITFDSNAINITPAYSNSVPTSKRTFRKEVLDSLSFLKDDSTGCIKILDYSLNILP